MKQPRWAWVLAVVLGAAIGLLSGSIGLYKPTGELAPTYTIEMTEDVWIAFSEWLKENE